MADSAGPVDLIDLAHGAETRCLVRVTGRFEPGVLTGHDTLRAAVIVSSNGAQADGALKAGQTMAIAGDCGAGIGLLIHRNQRVAVRVHEPDRLSIIMKLPI